MRVQIDSQPSKEVRLPAEIAFGSSTVSNKTVSSYREYVEKLKSRMQSAHKLCRKNLKGNAKRQIDIYDQRQVLHKYEKGHLVWFLQPIQKKSLSKASDAVFWSIYDKGKAQQLELSAPIFLR